VEIWACVDGWNMRDAHIHLIVCYMPPCIDMYSKLMLYHYRAFLLDHHSVVYYLLGGTCVIKKRRAKQVQGLSQK
jgi:hypothetical protein